VRPLLKSTITFPRPVMKYIIYLTEKGNATIIFEGCFIKKPESVENIIQTHRSLFVSTPVINTDGY
jgi:hypothetical protein